MRRYWGGVVRRYWGEVLGRRGNRQVWQIFVMLTILGLVYQAWYHGGWGSKSAVQI